MTARASGRSGAPDLPGPESPASLDLTAAWQELRARRPTLDGVLAAYDPVLAAWAAQPVPAMVPSLTCGDCAPAWRRGVPAIAERPPDLPVPLLETFLEPALSAVVAARPDAEAAARRFAQAWDAGQVTPRDLLPARGRMGSVAGAILEGPLVAFIAQASLYPVLQRWSGPVRDCALQGWSLGVCPFCGAPPAFADILEDGQRRLACGVCGAGWPAARLWCPFCGNDRSGDLRSLQPEVMSDQGYAIQACGACRGYLKELDRRVRWNGGPPLLEDWGSPHLDVAAARAGYWRPLPTLVDLAGTARAAGGTA